MTPDPSPAPAAAKPDILPILRADNPVASEVQLRLYAAALLAWHAADDNIRQYGTICTHPRTRAPFENPYLRIRDAQARVLAQRGFRSIRADRALSLLQSPSP